MFNIYEWNKETHQEFKQLLRDTNEMGVKFTKLSCVALKTAEVLQIPTNVMIKMGKSLIDIVKEEAVDLMDTFQLIDNITETKEEREQRKVQEALLKEWELRSKKETIKIKLPE